MSAIDADTPHRRPAPLIPPDGRRDAPLFCVVAVLVLLACLAGLSARAAWRAADEWTASLDAAATVQILAEDQEAADAGAARAAEILSGLDGVAAADALDRAEAEALLAPWFGEALPEELPAPRLVAVTLTPGADADLDAMRAALEAEGLQVEIDDHARWEDEIGRAAGAVQTLGVIVVALLAGAAGAVVVFAVQAGFAAKREAIEALRVAGAEDRLIAFLFLRRFFLVGLASGGAGAALAAAALGALYFGLSGQDGLVSLPAPGWGEALVLLAAPATSALVGAATAWITVLTELGRSR